MFSCQDPPLNIFTASFTINGMVYVSSSGDNTTTPFTGTGGLDPNSFGSSILNTTSNGTSHSVSATRSTASASSTSSAQPSSTLPPITPEDEEEYLRNHRGPGAASRNSGTALQVDYERLKFQLVFIVWPAIIGITMAL